jgi:hypothetical protein
LEGAGAVTHDAAIDKAHREYDAYKTLFADELNDVEKAYLETLKQMRKRLQTGGNGNE